jgi:hypothetical protein
MTPSSNGLVGDRPTQAGFAGGAPQVVVTI